MLKSWYFLVLLFLISLGFSVWRVIDIPIKNDSLIFYSFMIGWSSAFILVLIGSRRAWKKMVEEPPTVEEPK